MKKIYTYLSVLLIICAVNANATIWQVTVNDGSFSPNTLPNVVCGDTVGWILSPTATLPHTATSTTIPAGAPTFNGSVAPVYAYVVPSFAGVYNYKCAYHLFTGSFTVTCATGINEAQSKISSLVSPNPFASSITLINYNADAANITDMTGRVVKTITLNTSTDKAEINLDSLVPGIYFLITSKEGVIRETKRIVKAK